MRFIWMSPWKFQESRKKGIQRNLERSSLILCCNVRVGPFMDKVFHLSVLSNQFNPSPDVINCFLYTTCALLSISLFVECVFPFVMGKSRMNIRPSHWLSFYLHLPAFKKCTLCVVCTVNTGTCMSGVYMICPTVKLDSPPPIPSSYWLLENWWSILVRFLKCVILPLSATHRTV